MKLGINGATMRPWSLQKQIADASAAGFQGIEIWGNKLQEYLSEHSIESLIDLLESHNLPLIGTSFVWIGYGDGQAERIAAMRELAPLTARLKGTSVALAPTMPPDGLSKTQALEKAAAEVRDLARIAGEYGLDVTVEPIGLHPVIPGPREVMEIINKVNLQNVKVLFDVYHYFWSSISLDDIALVPVSRIGEIHINDAEDIPKTKLTQHTRLYPTLGVIPAADMLRIERNLGYDGYIVVEVFRAEYWEKDPDLAAHSMYYLEALLARVPWERKN